MPIVPMLFKQLMFCMKPPEGPKQDLECKTFYWWSSLTAYKDYALRLAVLELKVSRGVMPARDSSWSTVSGAGRGGNFKYWVIEHGGCIYASMV